MFPDDPPVFLYRLSEVFNQRVREYGDTPDGVLWKSGDDQRLRFEVLVNILNDAPKSSPTSISDFGCGYGAFFDFLATQREFPPFNYVGYDIAPDMIVQARNHIDDPRADFFVSDRPLRPADYTFVSGTYNLHADVTDDVWTDFIKTSLSQLWAKTDRGLAFNMLDKNHPAKLDGLYYADRDNFMDYAARLSPNVTLIDDYTLEEWTIFIRM